MLQDRRRDDAHVYKPLYWVYTHLLQEHRQNSVSIKSIERDRLDEFGAILQQEEDKIDKSTPTSVNRRAKEYKYSQIFCWKMDMSRWDFISFSIVTPAQATSALFIIVNRAA